MKGSQADTNQPRWEAVPSERSCHFQGLQHSTELALHKPSTHQDLHKFAVVYGMKWGMHQQIVKK